LLNKIKILRQKLFQTRKRRSYYLSLHSKYPSDESIKCEMDKLSDEEYKLEKDIKKLKR